MPESAECTIEFISVRENHIPLLSRWLKEPRVLEFWQETDNDEEIRQKFLHKILQRKAGRKK